MKCRVSQQAAFYSFHRVLYYKNAGFWKCYKKVCKVKSRTTNKLIILFFFLKILIMFKTFSINGRNPELIGIKDFFSTLRKRGRDLVAKTVETSVLDITLQI